MSDETILAIVDRANGKENSRIRLLSLNAVAPDVVFAEVEVQYPLSPTSVETEFTHTHDFYLIGHSDQYVAAIQDAGPGDLHWVVAPSFRKKGILAAALQRAILPHLFESRDWQQVSINLGVAGEYFEASKRVAQKAGFTEISSTEYETIYKSWESGTQP